jgi:hypothetical protein
MKVDKNNPQNGNAISSLKEELRREAPQLFFEAFDLQCFALKPNPR